MKINLDLSLATLQFTVRSPSYHAATTIDRYTYFLSLFTLPLNHCLPSYLVKGCCTDRNLLQPPCSIERWRQDNSVLSISLTTCFHDTSKSSFLLLKQSCIFPLAYASLGADCPWPRVSIFSRQFNLGIRWVRCGFCYIPTQSQQEQPKHGFTILRFT